MINKVILVGNVGLDPEVRALDSGVKVARLRLATTERFVDRQTNETKEQTEWHTITLWRGLADVVDKYVHKGSQLYIEGSLRTREWMDKDNQKRYTTEIVATDMKLLGRRMDGQSPQQTANDYSAQPAYQAPAPAAPVAPVAQPTYQQSAPAPQPAAQPSYQQPVVPANDADDLPF
ncbi:MAG: single-stranded DNA-binding protein [Alistipes sp.]|nr:single-stranded DNA-binding protein [Alistipes sp.]